MLLPQLSYSDIISVTLDLEDTDTTVCASMHAGVKCMGSLEVEETER